MVSSGLIVASGAGVSNLLATRQIAQPAILRGQFVLTNWQITEILAQLDLALLSSSLHISRTVLRLPLKMIPALLAV